MSSFSPWASWDDDWIPESKRPLRVVGIDLGTTNSAIAEIQISAGDAGKPQARCLDVEQQTETSPTIDTIVPSMLALHGKKIYVGKGAKELRARIGENKLEQDRNIFWDCKNDMGVLRTYHRAPVGYQSAREIGGHLLKFLAESSGGGVPGATVVTVPASFQAAQREDTRDAARNAGIELAEGALLDEPIAAFIDYAMSHGKDFAAKLSTTRRLVVFDFGGGTCDVALFELRPSKPSEPIEIAPLSVSRYCRLGGGDIDRKIATDILIPKLVEQNNLKPGDLDYHAKSKRVIPALLGCAESLKIALCREIVRLKNLGLYEEKRSELVQKTPNHYKCVLRDGTVLHLNKPTLSAEDLDQVLEPFLDRDLLDTKEGEYYQTCSIFAPLDGALERSRLEPEDVDYCLLVGGSSMISQVAEAVKAWFEKAETFRLDNEDMQQTVARGAAWQALSLAVRGEGIVRPVTNERIGIQTEGGFEELIPEGVELPWPAGEDWIVNDRLIVPETSDHSVPLRVEIRGDKSGPISTRVWDIPPPATEGEQLRLQYRMDVNQVLEMRLGRERDEADGFQDEVENPLTHIVNPNEKREEIRRLEEDLRSRPSSEEQRDKAHRISELCADLGDYDRAMSLLRELNRRESDASIVHEMAQVAGQMEDYDREEKFHREAAKMYSGWNGPLFNLTLSLRRQDRLDEALQTVDDALACEEDAATLVLKASILDELDRRDDSDGDDDGSNNYKSLLRRAFAEFDPVDILDDFELTWYRKGALLLEDKDRQRAGDEERRRRRRGGSPGCNSDSLTGTHLPKVRQFGPE